MAEWRVKSNEANIGVMADVLNISPITAHILANRGIRSKNAAIKFLNPILSYAYDMSLCKDAEKAARIIIKAKQKGVKIVIYGDYDVDGVMSTVILYKMLKRFGADVSYYIPHREEEGYGLNLLAVEKLSEEGCKLLITCDNGISASAEILRAKELSMAVIVIDHHEPQFYEENGKKHDIVPIAAAIVDPKQELCTYPFKNLCAAGLCYKFADYFFKLIGMPFIDENEFIILAAVATYCDIVDLVDENRIIAKNGTKRLNDGLCQNIGLNALLIERKIAGKEIGSYEIGFIIGPCINASGRLKHAEMAVELFTTDNITKAEELAKKLAELNDERKALTTQAVENTVNSFSQSEEKEDKVLVVYNSDVHESIAGIVAGRIKDTLNHPVIVLTKSGNLIKGSARSIESYNIFEELYKCRDLFVRFGGHAMAAGLSMKEENLPELRQRLNNACELTEEAFVKVMSVDKEIELDDATFALAKELMLLEPFGKENAEPVFCIYGIFTDQIDILGENKKTLRFTFSVDGVRKIKAICFSKMDEFMTLLRKSYSEKICDSFFSGDIKKLTVKMDIAFTIGINDYNGNTSVQLKILDFSF